VRVTLRPTRSKRIAPTESIHGKGIVDDEMNVPGVDGWDVAVPTWQCFGMC